MDRPFEQSMPATAAQGPDGAIRDPYAWLRAGDGARLRYGLWKPSAKVCRGTLLLLNGRSEYLEKYHEVINDLLARDLEVASFDWRGQGLSERQLADAAKGYVDTFDHYLLDLEAAINHTLSLCKGPLMLLAHSMGGHLALRYMHDHPNCFAKAVVCSPMTDINTAPMPKLLARLFSRLLRLAGFARSRIAGAYHYDPYGHGFDRNQITSDKLRYERIRRTITGNPALSAPLVTNGWLAAAFDSIDILNRPGFGSGIHTPLLVAIAGQDQIVINQATIRFVGYLPDCQSLLLQDARHEILQERDAIRTRFWESFDAFMESRPAT